jgi:hypothetical protein
VVTQARPGSLAAFLRMDPWPFPVVADPERAAYRAFGLGRTSWWKLLHPASLLHYLRLMFQGWGLRRPTPEEDLLQLGGDFVLAGDGRLVYARRGTATDRPPVAELLQAIRSAGTAPRR